MARTWQLDCGCVARAYDDSEIIDVEYCPSHAAGPELLQDNTRIPKITYTLDNDCVIVCGWTSRPVRMSRSMAFVGHTATRYNLRECPDSHAYQQALEVYRRVLDLFDMLIPVQEIV